MTVQQTASLPSVCAAKTAAEPKILSCSTKNYYNKSRSPLQESAAKISFFKALLRQFRGVGFQIAGLALVDNGNAVRAGVGADNAAQLEHDHRRMAERLFAQL